MKYIRTEYGIYEVVKEEKNYFLISSKNINEDCYDVPCVNKSDILKQADTIEELCDRFIAIYGHNDFSLTFSSDVLRGLVLSREAKEGYGLIHTDKGLIYKARMKGILPNGEIDWELL